MSNHAMPRKGWKRAARGTMLGTAAAGVLILSGSTPTVAVALPDRAVARAADPVGGGYWLTDSDGEVYAFGGVSVLREPDEYAPQLPGCRDGLCTGREGVLVGRQGRRRVPLRLRQALRLPARLEYP